MNAESPLKRLLNTIKVNNEEGLKRSLQQLQDAETVLRQARERNDALCANVIEDWMFELRAAARMYSTAIEFEKHPESDPLAELIRSNLREALDLSSDEGI
jgi:hypothetical protein